MTLERPTRFASFVIAAVLSGATPATLMARANGASQDRTPQAAPEKPSADVARPASLPATQPTENATVAAVPAPVVPAEHCDVEFSDGKVAVDATNVSLNKLLHEVGTKTGIKITGSVSEERVFGHYGPARPSVVLATLLDGTGTNVLLVDDAKGGSELVLTQRQGGPTPPSALAAALETTTDEEGRPTSRYVSPGRNYQPPGPGRGPMVPPPNFGPPASQTTAPGGAVQGDPSQSSGDNRTTQQIYEQLQNAQKPQ